MKAVGTRGACARSSARAASKRTDGAMMSMRRADMRGAVVRRAKKRWKLEDASVSHAETACETKAWRLRASGTSRSSRARAALRSLLDPAPAA